MAEEGMRAAGVNLVLGSKGIKIDERGRIRFDEPEILQALVQGLPEGQMRMADDNNGFNCNCQNPGCTKPQPTIEL